MASQLSAVRPSALESRSAISGVIRLVPLRMRLRVEAATSSFSDSAQQEAYAIRLKRTTSSNAGANHVSHRSDRPEESLTNKRAPPTCRGRSPRMGDTHG
jgi:hypothetical protein